MTTQLSHTSYAASRPTPALLPLIAGMLFLATSCTTPSGTGKREPDFTHYDEPLYEQITNRIGEKVMARLGEGKITQDRYFIVPYAYQNKGNDPAFSHSFLSVIHAYTDGTAPEPTPGLKYIEYKGHKFEAFTISWLPADFAENPRLCVFEGFGAAIVPDWNNCPAVPGKSFDLPGTLKLAVDAKVAVGMWGPYEISRPGFDLGVTRLRLLEKGEIKYRADDRGYRKRKEAINCFHAMQSLDDLFPDGGFLDTGLMMWGLNGTRQVLREYTTSARDKGLLLEPVDVDKDVIGFVYAPERSAEGVYNPFYGGSAYRK